MGIENIMARRTTKKYGVLAERSYLRVNSVIRIFPCLYAVNFVEYHNKTKKNNAYKVIAKQISRGKYQ